MISSIRNSNPLWLCAYFARSESIRTEESVSLVHNAWLSIFSSWKTATRFTWLTASKAIILSTDVISCVPWCLDAASKQSRSWGGMQVTVVVKVR